MRVLTHPFVLHTSLRVMEQFPVSFFPGPSFARRDNICIRKGTKKGDPGKDKLFLSIHNSIQFQGLYSHPLIGRTA